MEELNAIRAQTMRLDKLDRQFIRAAYDEEIAYVDHELDRFLEALEQRSLLERGLVLFTSDHGEELFDLDANPGERLLPWDEHADKADDLQRALLQRLERDLGARTEQTPAELGSDTLEQLRSLGYVR